MSKVPVPGVPPGIQVNPAGSGLGFDQWVVSMICTTLGLSGGDTDVVVTAARSNVALVVVLLERSECCVVEPP